MNLIEIAYTKIKYIIRKFLRIRQLSFFIGEHRNKPHAEIVEDPC